MPAEYEIRADFDRESIVIYQAYSVAIAKAALDVGRFVPPFSFGRMTWIKPSFLWLMHRSRWGLKVGQERILAVRILRAGWEKALSHAVLTSFDRCAFRSPEDWDHQFRRAKVHLQWDPERSLRGSPLPYYSVQVGISRELIAEYVESWILSIEDMTPRVRKIHEHLKAGRVEEGRRLLPTERVYEVGKGIGQRIKIKS